MSLFSLGPPPEECDYMRGTFVAQDLSWHVELITKDDLLRERYRGFWDHFNETMIKTMKIGPELILHDSPLN